MSQKNAALTCNELLPFKGFLVGVERIHCFRTKSEQISKDEGTRKMPHSIWLRFSEGIRLTLAF